MAFKDYYNKQNNVIKENAVTSSDELYYDIIQYLKQKNIPMSEMLEHLNRAAFIVKNHIKKSKKNLPQIKVQNVSPVQSPGNIA